MRRGGSFRCCCKIYNQKKGRTLALDGRLDRSQLDRHLDLMHAPEPSRTNKALATWTRGDPWKRPVWRCIAGTEAGQDYLNARRTNVYTISYQQTPVVGSKPRRRQQIELFGIGEHLRNAPGQISHLARGFLKRDLKGNEALVAAAA